MLADEQILNDLLVETFNTILKMEQSALRSGVLSDLSITEIHTIDAIGLGDGLSMGEVAAKLHVALATLTTAIHRLVKKNYVERQRMAEDRRTVLLRLTRAGRRAYRIHLLYHQKMVRAALQGMNHEQCETLTQALVQMRAFFLASAATGEIQSEEDGQ